MRRSGRSGHGVGDDELPRTSRLLRREAQRELAVVANAFPHLDAGEPSAHLRIRRGPSPDRYLLLALQHCAVAEQPREDHRLRGGRVFSNHRHRASAPRASRAARRRDAVLHVRGACGDDVALELDVLRRVRADRSVRVDDLGRHVRQIADALARKAHVRRRAGGAQHGRSAVGVNGLQFAGLVGKLELRLPVGGSAHVALSDEPAVEVELHLRTARVDFGDDLLPLPALEVPALPCRPHAPARLLDLPAPSVGLAHGEVCRRLGIPQRLSPVRDRFAPSGQVDVAAVRSVPREGCAGDFVVFPVRLRAVVVGASDRRLAEIVDAGPHELAGDVSVRYDAAPDLRGVARERLGVHNHPVRTARLVLFRELLGVVVSDDVKSRGELVLGKPLALAAPRAERHRDRTRRVELAAAASHRLRVRDGLLRRALEYFVAYRPHRDGRMHPVAAHDPRKVLKEPFPEHLGVVTLVLWLSPAVEHVVYYEKTLGVARVEERLAHRIVARAHRVESRGFELADLAQLRCVVGCRAERTVVVVHAGAVQLHALSVQKEAALLVPSDGADPRPHAFAEEVEVVELRRIWRPENGVLDLVRLRLATAAD